MIIIGQVSGKEVFEQQMELSFGKQNYKAHYFIDQGEQAWVVSSQQRHSFSVFQYGMIPFWSRNPVFHFESPVEGSVNPGVKKLKKRIILHPSYRRPIRENRCIVPVDYIILTSETAKPYLVFSMASKSFALAAIYDNWKENHLQKDSYQGFSILTIPASPDFQNVGIKRMPLVLPVRKYMRWLNTEVPLAEVTSLMEDSIESDLNAYPISAKMYSRKLNGRDLCRPMGDLVKEENRDISKMTSFIRSFRYRLGISESKKEPQERIWRGE